MKREPHENVATVLVDPSVLGDLELALMLRDLPLWPIRSAPICVDGPRMEFQVRRRLIESHRGDWDLAAEWVPVWVGFGPTWRLGDEPLPWQAHKTLWEVLDGFSAGVRFRRRLGGVRPLSVPEDLSAYPANE